MPRTSRKRKDASGSAGELTAYILSPADSHCAAILDRIFQSFVLFRFAEAEILLACISLTSRAWLSRVHLAALSILITVADRRHVLTRILGLFASRRDSTHCLPAIFRRLRHTQFVKTIIDSMALFLKAENFELYRAMMRQPPLCYIADLSLYRVSSESDNAEVEPILALLSRIDTQESALGDCSNQEAFISGAWAAENNLVIAWAMQNLRYLNQGPNSHGEPLPPPTDLRTTDFYLLPNRNRIQEMIQNEQVQAILDHMRYVTKVSPADLTQMEILPPYSACILHSLCSVVRLRRCDVRYHFKCTLRDLN